MPIKDLLVLAYKSKNVGQILALKTRHWLIHLSACRHLVNNLNKAVTNDSRRREMLAKCQQSWSMTVTADDTESAADAQTQTSRERCSSSARCSLPVTSARHHHLRTTHLPASTTSSQVAAAACRHCLHAAGRSATAVRPVRKSPPAARRWRSHPSVYLCTNVEFWTSFVSKEGVELYAIWLIWLKQGACVCVKCLSASSSVFYPLQHPHICTSAFYTHVYPHHPLHFLCICALPHFTFGHNRNTKESNTEKNT